MSDAARAKALDELFSMSYYKQDDWQQRAGHVLDAFAAEQAARAVDPVGDPMGRAADLSAALGQVARLREELMGHAHACAACRALLAAPAVPR